MTIRGLLRPAMSDLLFSNVSTDFHGERGQSLGFVVSVLTHTEEIVVMGYVHAVAYIQHETNEIVGILPL